MSSARIRSTATIGRNMREDPMMPAESRPQAVCARSCALRFAEMLERDAHRVKRIEDLGRNTVRFVDPDAVPRIRDQLESAYGPAGWASSERMSAPGELVES